MSDNDQCPCWVCGSPTSMLVTKLCDECWELDRRIRRHPRRAQKILETLRDEKSQGTQHDLD